MPPRTRVIRDANSFARAFVVLALVSALRLAISTPIQPVPPHKGITHGSYIRYYEAASYDTAALRRHRSRMRRDVSDGDNQPLLFHLEALDRSWTIRLVADAGLFSNDVIFESTEGPINYDTSHSYVGTVMEDESAIVEGVVTNDGLFDGTVTTGLEQYYIEPTSRYLSGDEDTSPAYHSIAYRTSDVASPNRPGGCASERLRRGGLLQGGGGSLVSGGRYNDSWRGFYEPVLGRKAAAAAALYSRQSSNARISSDESNHGGSTRLADISGERYARHLQKRATVDPRKTTCMLYLQADHQFFSRYGTEEACIEVMTRHVQRVNSIYKHTDFNQDGRPDNISFMIKRVKVHSGDALRDPSYRFPGNYGVEKYLELFSEEDYDAFCLAYMFTYRDFEMGTLGLAWTGDLKNAGGVCEKNGHYRGSMKSLNTGIVTLLNYGKHVPPAVSHVTLAHEIGHNFGSPHDPEQCTPGGEDGNFIMFARATSGDKRNNNRFSPCSLNAINPVLNSKARSPKGCFTEPQASLCGNGVVEQGEQCDCGWEEDCRDSCCFPQRRYPPPEETPCTLTPRAICSPSQGPCCTAECNLKFGDKCRDDNGCRDASFCDGRSPYCPPSINKPNKTICNREFVCFMGECTGSICLAYGLESCQCIPGPNDLPTKACELCCRLPGENRPCRSSFDWNSQPYDVPDMFSKPGTPCNDYNGYCDVFQKCREVDPSGPLATLRKLLLSEESLATFRRWIAEHWYAAAFIGLAAISLLAVSARLLGKRPDPKLKSVTIIHSSTTETVRLPPEGAEGVTVHPAAVRAKLPLSKKVREKRRHRKHKEARCAVDNKSGKEMEKQAQPQMQMQLQLQLQMQKQKQKQKKQQQYQKRSASVPVDDSSRNRVVDDSVVQEKKRDKKKKKKKLASRDTQNPPVANSGGGGDNEKRRRKKHQRNEVIDYSSMQTEKESESKADPKSKVRSWLLASSQCRVDTRNGNLPKSKSTPVGLTGRGGGRGEGGGKISASGQLQSQSQVQKEQEQKQEQEQQQQQQQDQQEQPQLPRRQTDSKVVLGNDRNCKKERARLQVVYKPPFRFSVKLRKADKVAQTPALAPATAHGNVGRNSSKMPRTGVLLRTRRKDRVRIGRARQVAPSSVIANRGGETEEPANSDLHTVPSDLEVLLSESEFLFSDT